MIGRRGLGWGEGGGEGQGVVPTLRETFRCGGIWSQL